MRSETKTCQNCEGEFIIEPEDFQFYEKIDVPVPTFCPDCRMQRRIAYRNDLILYHDTCDLCDKKMLSIYNPDVGATVYCTDCWWGDDWDPLDFGTKYDFDRPFFEQIYEHFKKVPRPAVDNKGSTNCTYCQATTDSNNCYLLFGGYEAENCMYGSHILIGKEVVDCTRLYKSDLCYESVQCTSCYKVLYSAYSFDCMESSFLYDCRGCNNCTGCVGLRNKEYHILNKPYTKEEYKERMKNLDFRSYNTVQKFKKEFQKLYDMTPRPYAYITNSPNSTGNMLSNCKNCKQCFYIQDGAENCKYSYFAGLGFKDSYDVYGGGAMSELTYECSGLLASQNVRFGERIYTSINIDYCSRMYNCKNMFGCSGLQNKQYCIFNMQYTEEEFHKLRDKIIQQMGDTPYIDSTGCEYRYGEYFPIETSLFPYRDTSANENFPLSQDEIKKEGYRWYDDKERDYRPTLTPGELPDHLDDTPANITDEIIQCTNKGIACTEAYKITTEELQLYKKIGVPLPRMCFNCRNYNRTDRELPIKTWEQSCHCIGKSDISNKYNNTIEHFHQGTSCPNNFLTPRSPESREIVYCKECYEHEIL